MSKCNMTEILIEAVTVESQPQSVILICDREEHDIAKDPYHFDTAQNFAWVDRNSRVYAMLRHPAGKMIENAAR